MAVLFGVQASIRPADASLDLTIAAFLAGPAITFWLVAFVNLIVLGVD